MVLTLISCPGCGVPAEITERFALPSTEGPVAHVVVDCAAGHHLRMAADRLPVLTQQARAETTLSAAQRRNGVANGYLNGTFPP